MAPQISPATRAKRTALQTFIDRHVVGRDEVKAIVVYGSVANGAAVADSDVDAIVFMDPLDHYLLPAEAIWNPQDDSFRSIFGSALGHDELQLDLMRVDWRAWADPGFHCPDDVRARLSVVWVAFERDGYDAASIIRRVTTMTDDQQQALLDEGLLAIDGLPEDAEDAWNRDPVEALDALNAHWEALLRCVYAINRTWFPYRARALRNVPSLTWDGGLSGDLLRTCAGGALDHTGYRTRWNALAEVTQRILEHVSSDPRYGDDPIFAAFLRQHDEPGRAWNMAEWNERHSSRQAQ